MGMFSSDPTEKVKEAAGGSEPEQTGADIAVIVAGLSVLLSWYQFFYKKNRLQGIFIGLWPPTILGFANYMKAKSLESQNVLKKLLN